MNAGVALVLVALAVSMPSDTESTFSLPSGVNVKITEALFERNLFKVSGCTETSATCFINGRVPLGTASGMPKTYVKKISVSYHDRSYSLDASDMYDAWGGRPLEHKGAVRYFGGKCFDKRNCQFRGLFSDAAGTFVAEWRVVNGLPIRTVLTDSQDIVHLFMQHIDPPEFD